MRGAVGIELGVAPVAATLTVAVPLIEVLPTAVASCTMAAGTVSRVWKLVRLNCCPGDGAAGDKAPEMATSLNTRSPIGVFVQKSSNADVSAKAGAVMVCTATPIIIIEPATSATAPATLMCLAKFVKRSMGPPVSKLATGARRRRSHA